MVEKEQQLVWDCYGDNQTKEESKGGEGEEKGKKAKWGRDFPFVSLAHLYNCTSVSVTIMTFLVGPSWFSCEIVLVIFKLIGCLSN